MKRPAILALTLLLTGCSLWGPEGGPGGGTGATGPANPPAARPVTAVTGPDGVQRITIQATDTLQFQPSLIRAHPGVIDITVHNTGVTPHTFTLPALPTAGIDNLNGGQTRTIHLTITRPGHYAFQCAYHATNGMHGELDIS